MKSVLIRKWLTDIFDGQTKPFDWANTHIQVAKDIDRLNKALETIGSVAKFTLTPKPAGLEIHLNNEKYKPVTSALNAYGASMHEIEACVDGTGKTFGLSLKYPSGPRPAGLTVESLKSHQIASEIRRHLPSSLSYNDRQKLSELQDQKHFIRDFRLN